MYNRYTCPLQPCTHFSLKLLIQGHPQSAKVTHIVDFISASAVNGNPVYRISFRLGRNDEIRKEYLSTGY